MKNKINVLDSGFVRLVDNLGNDDTVANSARVSYGEGTKKTSNNATLIRYLMRSKHTSPFEHVIFTFHIKAPIFIFRQWHRHRTWSFSEISGRYSVLPEECYVPKEEHVTTQDPSNKQGGTNELVAYEETELAKYGGAYYRTNSIKDRSWEWEFETEQRGLKDQYQLYIESGMRRELARINQPVSQYSEMYATVNLHNLFHFLKLRMDKHAQWEIREYADALFELIKPIVPEASSAFEDYILNSMSLSSLDIEAIKEVLNIDFEFDIEERLKDASEAKFSNKRERSEFINKVNKLLTI